MLTYLLLASLLALTHALLGDYCETVTPGQCPPCRTVVDRCNPLDDYFSNSDICVLPNQLPEVVQLCGEPYEVDLTDEQNYEAAGTLTLMQSSDGLLFVTVKLNCPHVLRSDVSGSDSVQYALGLYAWSSPDLIDSPQYVDVFPVQGTYTCLSSAIDLGHVCDPSRSLYSYMPLAQVNHGCDCFPGMWPCPSTSFKQGAAPSMLYLSVSLNSPRVDNFCQDASEYVQLKARTADGTGIIQWSPQSCSSLEEGSNPPPVSAGLPAGLGGSLAPPRPPAVSPPPAPQQSYRPPALPPWPPSFVPTLGRRYRTTLFNNFHSLGLDEPPRMAQFQNDFAAVISQLAQVDPKGVVIISVLPAPPMETVNRRRATLAAPDTDSGSDLAMDDVDAVLQRLDEVLAERETSYSAVAEPGQHRVSDRRGAQTEPAVADVAIDILAAEELLDVAETLLHTGGDPPDLTTFQATRRVNLEAGRQLADGDELEASVGTEVEFDTQIAVTLLSSMDAQFGQVGGIPGVGTMGAFINSAEWFVKEWRVEDALSVGVENIPYPPNPPVPPQRSPEPPRRLAPVDLPPGATPSPSPSPVPPSPSPEPPSPSPEPPWPSPPPPPSPSPEPPSPQPPSPQALIGDIERPGTTDGIEDGQQGVGDAPSGGSDNYVGAIVGGVVGGVVALAAAAVLALWVVKWFKRDAHMGYVTDDIPPVLPGTALRKETFGGGCGGSRTPAHCSVTCTPGLRPSDHLQHPDDASSVTLLTEGGARLSMTSNMGSCSELHASGQDECSNSHSFAGSFRSLVRVSVDPVMGLPAVPPAMFEFMNTEMNPRTESKPYAVRPPPMTVSVPGMAAGACLVLSPSSPSAATDKAAKMLQVSSSTPTTLNSATPTAIAVSAGSIPSLGLSEPIAAATAPIAAAAVGADLVRGRGTGKPSVGKGMPSVGKGTSYMGKGVAAAASGAGMAFMEAGLASTGAGMSYMGTGAAAAASGGGQHEINAAISGTSPGQASNSLDLSTASSLAASTVCSSEAARAQAHASLAASSALSYDTARAHWPPQYPRVYPLSDQASVESQSAYLTPGLSTRATDSSSGSGSRSSLHHPVPARNACIPSPFQMPGQHVDVALAALQAVGSGGWDAGSGVVTEVVQQCSGAHHSLATGSSTASVRGLCAYVNLSSQHSSIGDVDGWQGQGSTDLTMRTSITHSPRTDVNPDEIIAALRQQQAYQLEECPSSHELELSPACVEAAAAAAVTAAANTPNMFLFPDGRTRTMSEGGTSSLGSPNSIHPPAAHSAYHLGAVSTTSHSATVTTSYRPGAASITTTNPSASLSDSPPSPPSPPNSHVGALSSSVPSPCSSKKQGMRKSSGGSSNTLLPPRSPSSSQRTAPS